MTTFGRTTALALATLVSLGGCGASTDFGADYATDEMTASMPASVDIEESGVMDTGLGVLEEAASSKAIEPDVITTGYLSLTVDSPSESAEAIAALVVDAGGRIASRSDYTPVDYGTPSSYIEARIPVEALDVTLVSIKDLGMVQEVSVNSYDVSLQKVDLDARLQVLEAAQARLAELLTQATTTGDLIAIETALSERQAELDSLQGQREYLSDQTLFSTVNISLTTPEGATATNPDGFLDGLIRGWQSIVAFALGTVVWAGILLPWLGILAIIIATAMVVRVIRRRKK